MKRGDTVHTPDGWGLILGIDDRVSDDPCTGEQIVYMGFLVLLERPDGTDDGWPLWYRRGELELETSAVDAESEL